MNICNINIEWPFEFPKDVQGSLAPFIYLYINRDKSLHDLDSSISKGSTDEKYHELIVRNKWIIGGDYSGIVNKVL